MISWKWTRPFRDCFCEFSKSLTLWWTYSQDLFPSQHYHIMAVCIGTHISGFDESSLAKVMLLDLDALFLVEPVSRFRITHFASNRIVKS